MTQLDEHRQPVDEQLPWWDQVNVRTETPRALQGNLAYVPTMAVRSLPAAFIAAFHRDVSGTEAAVKRLDNGRLNQLDAAVRVLATATQAEILRRTSEPENTEYATAE